ncbi:MAG: 4-alpha-glucanotransferase [Gammaproteobacteria bacterium]|jgi:4-alpha-glucanotransferase
MHGPADSPGLLTRRRAGVLLHPTSLPGPGTNGTLGDSARRFVDFLAESGFSVWQTLPLGPVDEHGSPYSLSSAYAGDVRLIDPASLGQLGELPRDLPFESLHADRRVLYDAFRQHASGPQIEAFSHFVHCERDWLVPYALFVLCAERFRTKAWWHWPGDFADRDDDALRELRANEAHGVDSIAFRQYLFALQWSAVKAYANERGVFVFGDLPFYMDRASADVWWDRRYFALDSAGEPLAVAGVPPDYFSEDGQLWGNPLYDWQAMQSDDFAWWRKRLAFQLERFDLLRIDHFRALESFWSVPADAQSAKEGHWVPGYGDALLQALAHNGPLPLVAEDLGIITDAVRELRDRFHLPGMAVLQFAFDGSPDNPHLPANVAQNSVFYTGTHDNDTLRGWFDRLDSGMRSAVAHTLGVGVDSLPASMLRTALETRAKLVILPLQDLLDLGSAARMNTPGTVEGNWRWRFEWSQFAAGLGMRMKKLLQETDRCRPDSPTRQEEE